MVLIELLLTIGGNFMETGTGEEQGMSVKFGLFLPSRYLKR